MKQTRFENLHSNRICFCQKVRKTATFPIHLFNSHKTKKAVTIFVTAFLCLISKKLLINRRGRTALLVAGKQEENDHESQEESRHAGISAPGNGWTHNRLCRRRKGSSRCFRKRNQLQQKPAKTCGKATSEKSHPKQNTKLALSMRNGTHL